MPPSAPDLSRLTPRQREVYGLLVEGLTNKEIAGKLRISARTVQFHASAALHLLGFHDRRELLLRLLGGTPRTA